MDFQKTLSRLPQGARIPLVLLLIYLLSIVVYGTIYWAFELDYSVPGNQYLVRCLSFFESYYVSVITITTLGYGDFAPFSLTAKFLSATQALLGVSLVGLIFVAIGMEISKSQERAMTENARKIQKARLDYLYSRISSILTNALDRFDENRAPIAMSGGGYYRFGHRYKVLARNVSFSKSWLEPSLGENLESTERAAKYYASTFDLLDEALRDELDRFSYLIEDIEMIELFENLSTTLNTQVTTLRRRSGRDISHDSFKTNVLNDIKFAFININKVRQTLFTHSDGYVDGGTARYSMGRDPFAAVSTKTKPRGKIREYLDI